MSVDRQRRPNNRPTVRVRGRQRAYLERRRIGRREYFLLEQIGSPLRARYLAFDPQQGPGGDFFLVQRLPADAATEQRLRVLSRLKDDSFPRVVEWHRSETNIDVVTTWIEGISLSTYFGHIRSGRRPAVAPSHAVRLILGLVSAVCKLHHKLQVAHGDIQPDNIIITSHPSRLVLIDFGSAWTTDMAAFRQEGDGHHRCYTAPELQLINGRPVAGFFADQFSVGAIFYELLTQTLPYGGLGGKAGRPELIAKSQSALKPPSQLVNSVADLPRSLQEQLDHVAMRTIALVPESRYLDRHHWLDDISRLSASFRLAPVDAGSISFFTRVIQSVCGKKLSSS
jgi:serine/threonine protein kinase